MVALRRWNKAKRRRFIAGRRKQSSKRPNQSFCFGFYVVYLSFLLFLLRQNACFQVTHWLSVSLYFASSQREIRRDAHRR